MDKENHSVNKHSASEVDHMIYQAERTHNSITGDDRRSVF